MDSNLPKRYQYGALTDPSEETKLDGHKDMHDFKSEVNSKGRKALQRPRFNLETVRQDHFVAENQTFFYLQGLGRKEGAEIHGFVKSTTEKKTIWAREKNIFNALNMCIKP